MDHVRVREQRRKQQAKEARKAEEEEARKRARKNDAALDDHEGNIVAGHLFNGITVGHDVPAIRLAANEVYGNTALGIDLMLPAFDDFPSDDVVADTARYVAVLEEQVRACPEQYLWIHRKFKSLPDGYPDYYADLEASK